MVEEKSKEIDRVPVTQEVRSAAVESALDNAAEFSGVGKLRKLYVKLLTLQAKGNLTLKERAQEELIKKGILYLSKPGTIENVATAASIIIPLGFAVWEGKMAYDSLQMIFNSSRNISLIGEWANITNALPKLQQVLSEFSHIGQYGLSTGEHGLKSVGGLGVAYLMDRFHPFTKIRKAATYLPYRLSR